MVMVKLGWRGGGGGVTGRSTKENISEQKKFKGKQIHALALRDTRLPP